MSMPAGLPSHTHCNVDTAHIVEGIETISVHRHTLDWPNFMDKSSCLPTRILASCVALWNHSWEGLDLYEGG